MAKGEQVKSAKAKSTKAKSIREKLTKGRNATGGDGQLKEVRAESTGVPEDVARTVSDLTGLASAWPEPARSPPKKIPNKVYEKELARLQIELVKLQEWMFLYTDIKQAPWYVVDADVKKRARLNCISHLLSLIPYEDLTPKPITLPPRQEDVGYVRPPITDQTFVPEVY